MALASVMSFVGEGSMKRTTVICPLCKKHFDPRTPLAHIKNYHRHASDFDLARIRDARRSCFGQSKPQKQKSPCLSIFLMKISKA
jgi:hypothetical protein